ncbi:hypothetical protein B0A52_02489 [Exophiala mesophila]|uniref:Eukaryotic translation initiation factor 4E type 2 n=1 Tax=Exophiala mesophila TaxID=212818 RepID=A0A438NCU4_EXOME|nr:hypothetical protein B0A52_02489 [Exophiala mesophila]
MEKSGQNLWTRRSNTGKLSLSMRDADNKDAAKTESPRSYNNRRLGDTSSHGRNNFNFPSPSATKSPSAASASSAFNLGSGAFASFGSAAKTPKTPGTGAGFDFSGRDKRDKEAETGVEAGPADKSADKAPSSKAVAEHPLRYTWNVYYRPPNLKFTDYEKSILQIAAISTAESFWTIYSHLKPPSFLPTISDYHIFKEGIRPVWEDDANKKGGKWIVRLKKGVADRYWESLVLAIIGDQFLEASDEVCGAVLSVRKEEDILSVWTKNDGGRNVKIRDTIKRELAFPADTSITWKSHDESIAQRSQLDESRQQKGTGTSGGTERRRFTLHDEADKNKVKQSPS